MARHVEALGLSGLIWAMETLGRGEGCELEGRRLEPGFAWGFDSLLLSATPSMVRYASGDSVVREPAPDFAARADWLNGRVPVWMPFPLNGLALRMAPVLAEYQGQPGSICGWLNSFAMGFAARRTDFELAARHAATLLETLIGLRMRHRQLFDALGAAAGPRTVEYLERAARGTGGAALLTLLLIAQVRREGSLEPLAAMLAALRAEPTPEYQVCAADPYHGRALRRMEDAAIGLSRVMPVLTASLRF